MKRDDFYHLLRAASRIIEDVRARRGIDVEKEPTRLLVLGSQSILGSWHDDYLPPPVKESIEIDVAVMPTQSDEWSFDDPVQELANCIDFNIGEGTHFQDSFDVYAQGVEEATAVLPDGWKDRLVKVDGRREGINADVYCLDPYDLCVAKLARLEEKDRRYVAALVDAGDIDVGTLSRRLDMVTDPRLNDGKRALAMDFITALRQFSPDRRKEDAAVGGRPDAGGRTPARTGGDFLAALGERTRRAIDADGGDGGGHAGPSKRPRRPR